METESATPYAAGPRATRRASSLALHLGLSLLFAVAMSQLVIFNYDTTTELWLTWMVAWGVIWVVFALLQIRWWARGDAKFWRPIYGWALMGHIVLSLIFLPVLLWPRFRRWLLRVMKPTDPPGWGLDASLKALISLRDQGLLTSEEFEAKRAELLQRI